MKALYLFDTSADLDQAPQRAKAGIVMGQRVYRVELYRALMKYGTYDRIFLRPAREFFTRDLRDSPEFLENQNRVQDLHDHQLATLKTYSPAVFLTARTTLGSLTRLRIQSQCGRASIQGIIHSLNTPNTIRLLFDLFLSPLSSHDAIVCSSRAGHTVMMKYLQVIDEKLRAAGWPPLTVPVRFPIIPLGVEVSDYEDADAGDVRATLGAGEAPLILYFGRFSALTKGDLLPLMVAFARVSAVHPDAVLVLAGDDTRHKIADRLEELARRVAPQAKIRVVANPDSQAKRQLYAAADIFVSPSDNLQETFGITLIEAMAAGLPAVASDWNGYKELVVHDSTGFLVRTTMPEYDSDVDGDLESSGSGFTTELLAATTIISVPQLADALERLVRDPELRRAMGARGRARAKALFDWPVIIAAYEALWAELALEAERHPDAVTVGLDLDRFSKRDIFAHYPTDYLAADAVVRVSTNGETRASLEWLIDSAQLPSVFQRDVFDSIVSQLRDGRSITVSALLQGLAGRSHVDDFINTAHICRLIKYGLIERADEVPLEADTRRTMAKTASAAAALVAHTHER